MTKIKKYLDYGHEEVLSVMFEGSVYLQDNSIDGEYGGVNCTYKRQLWVVEDVIWDRKKHNEEENSFIKNYLLSFQNYDGIEDELIKKYQNEQD